MSTEHIRLIVSIAVFAACLTVAAATGWTINGWCKDAEISKLKEDQAQASAQAATEARQRLEAAQARGDALQTRLAAAEIARKTQVEETSRELKRLTSGRPCLSGAAVRLLNQPGLRLGARSAPAGQPAAADAASATDTDLGLWMAAAIGQYGECRDRLQALIDWHRD